MQVIRISDGVVELQEVGEVKRARLSEFYEALVADRGYSTPLLPPGTVHLAIRGRVRVYTVEASSLRRPVRFSPRDGRPQEYLIPFPWTYLLISFVEEALNELRVFFTPTQLRTLDDPLCHAPLPNRYPDGLTCMGNFKFEIASTLPAKIEEAVRYFFQSSFTAEILDSFTQFIPEPIAVRTGSGENWFHGWSRLSDEELSQVKWKPYKPFAEAVDRILERK